MNRENWRHETEITKQYDQNTGVPKEYRADWIKSETRNVALLCGHYSRPEVALNDGALIAAAPDLLKAITYYFDVLEEVQGASWNKNPDHVLEKMLDAVAKAKGTLREQAATKEGA